MRKAMYESGVIVNASLEDAQIEVILNKITDTIKNNGGEIHEVENWGRKRLAYQIKKHRLGYYYFLRYEAPSNVIAILNRVIRLDESIIRSLTIKLDKNALEYFSQRKLQEEALAKVAEELEEVAKDAPESEVSEDLKSE